MRKTLAALGALAVLAGSAPTSAQAAGVHGDYVEARTNDIFTGPCFSNAEIFITGHQAVLAWHVNQGSYNGVDISGLSIAAAIRGSSTFSVDLPDQAKTILIIDKNANDRQRSALIAMARSLAGDRLKNVVDVKTSIISLTVESAAHESASAEKSHADHGMPQAPRARFWAPGLAEIFTRPLNDGDHFCGNEVVAYEPLSKGAKVLPAYTLSHTFKAKGLGTNWDDRNARTSFVGTFHAGS